MFHHQYELFVQERHNRILQEAEKQRLAQTALENQEQNTPFYYETLAALGRRLIDIGCRLQEQYGNAAPPVYVSKSAWKRNVS